MEEFVSIITPAWKAQSHLPNAVKSVLSQTHEDWELIVIADDNYDYRSLLESHNLADSRIHFFKTQKPQSGPNVARNIGLASAKGQWIAPLDADDVYYADRLEKLLVAGQSTGLALDDVNLSKGVGYQEKHRVLQDSAEQFTFEVFEKSLVPLLFLFNRELISQGWDEDVKRGADTLFNLRALEKVNYATYLDEPLHEYRVHNESMCHAPGSDLLFIKAYEHTLQRLKSDGLGFQKEAFRAKVITMLEQKAQINREFNTAIKSGYRGNYQEFVREKTQTRPN